MPTISNLSAGLKLSSNGNVNTLGQVVLSSNPIFNTAYFNGGITAPVFTNTATGNTTITSGQAAVFTVNPSAQAAGTIGVIVAGKALELFVEYNSLNQFRFNVVAASVAPVANGSPAVASAWYPVGTEHTVGVSYTNAGIVTMVVDGDFASSAYVDPTTMVSTTNGGLAIGSYSGNATGPNLGGATFNGFLGQVINFNGPLSPTELAAITADPNGAAGSLAGTVTPATNGHIETALSYRGVGASTTGTVNGVANVVTNTIGNTANNNSFFIEPSSITASATNAGVNAVTVNSATNLRVGDYVTGTGIADGNSIVNINGSVITLRLPTTSSINAGSALSIFHPEAVIRTEVTSSTSPSSTAPIFNGSSVPTATQIGFSGTPTLAAGDIVLKLDSIAGIKNGDLVSGGGLPAGYIVYPTTGILASTDSVVITPTSSTIASAAIASGSQINFVDPNARDAQSITIGSSNSLAGTVGYAVGDSIQITAASGAGTTVTKTYVVQASDIQSSPALTNVKIASSIVAANPTIGLYAVAQNTGIYSNQIVLAPTLNPSNAALATTSAAPTTFILPPVVVKSINTAQLNENNVLDAMSFASIPAGTLASSTFTLTSSAGATIDLANTVGANLLSSNGAINPGSSTYTGTVSSTTAAPVLKGPIYAEMVSYASTGGTGGAPVGIYDLFLNPTMVSGPLRSLGFTLTASSTSPSGKVISLAPSVVGSLSQSNVSSDGSNVNYQWVSSTAVTDFSKPIARLTVNNSDASQASFASTIGTISINGGYTMDKVTPNLTLVESAVLPNQVYAISGNVYQQYNKGSSQFDTSYSATNAQQVVIPGTDMTFTVKSPSANLNLNLQPVSSPVTVASPNPTVKLDVVDTLVAPGANTFSYNINVPSNATNVSFAPGQGVSNVSAVNNGSYWTISGTYGGTVTTTTTTGTPPVTTTTTAPAVLQNTSTPTLGTLTATLNNMMTSTNGVVTGGSLTNPSKGVQFSIDTATLNGTVATAQSLYFGDAETNSNGQYFLANLPLGQMTLNVYNNTTQAAINQGKVSLNDAMSALSIAAGKGVVTSTSVGAVGNLGVSDFVAADWNKDGKVTAADSLAILQYFVSYSNLNSAPLTYSYFPASQQGSVGVGKIGITNSAAPAFSTITTNINASNSNTLGIGGTQSLDIVGVLQGDVINA